MRNWLILLQFNNSVIVGTSLNILAVYEPYIGSLETIRTRIQDATQLLVGLHITLKYRMYFAKTAKIRMFEYLASSLQTLTELLAPNLPKEHFLLETAGSPE